jgi:naphthalene 1,2-dioxygenase system ferredoxin subunit
MPWISTIAPDQIDPEAAASVKAGNIRVALYQAGGEYYATSLMCTHGQASLADGYLEGHIIECPLHQGQFDIRTGEAVASPCYEPLQTFPVRLVDGILEVEVPDMETAG